MGNRCHTLVIGQQKKMSFCTETLFWHQSVCECDCNQRFLVLFIIIICARSWFICIPGDTYLFYQYIGFLCEVWMHINAPHKSSDIKALVRNEDSIAKIQQTRVSTIQPDFFFRKSKRKQWQIQQHTQKYGSIKAQKKNISKISFHFNPCKNAATDNNNNECAVFCLRGIKWIQHLPSTHPFSLHARLPWIWLFCLGTTNKFRIKIVDMRAIRNSHY